MSPECKALPAASRIASAAGALAITSVLLLAVGLGFPLPADAETAARPATAPQPAKVITVAAPQAARVITVAAPQAAKAVAVAAPQAAKAVTVAAPPATKTITVAAGGVIGAAPSQADTASVTRGRYLVSISGCNDCHTAGYSETGGRVAQSDWLLGQPVGFRGPWGVSYPANLRLTVQSVTEAEWLRFARVERLPPMPWFALRDMNDDDLRSMYRFIRSLGARGERMPAPLAPNANVGTPYIQFTPQNLPAVSQAAPAARQGGRG